MADTVAEQIVTFIKGRFPQAQIATDQDLFSLGYINSLFAMELVMFIEKAFGLAVPNTELRIENFRSVDAMTGLVDRQRSAIPVG